jgi:hypothetical protein
MKRGLWRGLRLKGVGGWYITVDGGLVVDGYRQLFGWKETISCPYIDAVENTSPAEGSARCLARIR